MNFRSVLGFLKKNKVAVLKGGWSKERPISLKTGKAIETSLRKLKIPFQSIDVRPNVEKLLKTRRVKFAYIALHGPFGEDGQIQNLLDGLGIPYTGEGPVVSSLAMNKASSKLLMLPAGVSTPRFSLVSKAEFSFDPKGVAKKLGPLVKRGCFVKPNDQGSALGATRVTRSQDLSKALKKCFQVSQMALIEKLTPGREFTVGILGAKALPVIEIIPENAFYDFFSKYAKGGSRHLAPAPLSASETKKIQSLALKAFQSIGGKVYGRIDFIRPRKNSFEALEINTIPGMTQTSLFPEAAKVAGISFENLLLRLADLSLKARRAR